MGEEVEIKSETEYMEDDEHRATMLKLYNPNPPKPSSSKQRHQSKADKSISPELLRMGDSTEPPSFTPIDNQTEMRPHIIDHQSFIFDNMECEDLERKYKIEIDLGQKAEDKDEVDTASDKFAAGFIGDDHTHSLNSPFSNNDKTATNNEEVVEEEHSTKKNKVKEKEIETKKEKISDNLKDEQRAVTA